MDIIWITTLVITVIGLCVGAGLVFTGKKFAVKVDEREVAVRESGAERESQGTADFHDALRAG